jgi:cysteine desulfurase
MTKKRTYLDCNASVPLRREARAAMLTVLDVAGNPSSVHAEGRHARAVVEAAREQVALLVNANPSEVIFTSGATEANNWVLAAGWNAIAVAGIEHDSVTAPVAASGAERIELSVATNGVAELDGLSEALAASAEASKRTLLTLMMANNETGVIQPVAEAAALAREHGVMVHTDAVQAPGRIPVDFAALGLDALSLSSHKLGGPRGVGALVVRDGVELPALIKGGGQERRRRGGTENISGIAGFGAAAEAVANEQDAAQHMAKLRDRLEDGVRRATPAAVIIGKDAPRLANTAYIAVPGKLAETLVIKLDLEGIAVSAGAACSSGKVGASHVLEAMNLGSEIARSAVRVSIGPQTHDDDIAAFLAVWEMVAGGAALAA